MEVKLLRTIKSVLLSQGNWGVDFLIKNGDLFGDVSYFIFNNEEKKFKYLSDHFLTLIGYSATDLKSATFEDIASLVHEDDYTGWLVNLVTASEDYLQNYSEDNYCKRAEYRVKHKKNYWVHLEILSTSMEVRQGKLISMFGIVKDISEQKHKESFLMNEISKRETSVANLRKIIHQYKNLDSLPQLKQPHGRISPREIEVLQLISQGYSNREIAETLFISPNTAVTHRKNLLVKFNVKNSAQLVKEASRMFWLI
ncbi:MAG: LuxR C-terminal-related transcriptional regulator [Cyclobacteriaceae bacterium]